MPELELPQRPPKMYCPPRGVIHAEDQVGQHEGNWSDTPSESDEHENETSRDRVEEPGNVNLGRPRNRHHHRSRLWDPGDARDTIGDDTSYLGRQTSGHGGQTVPYDQHRSGCFSPPYTQNPFSPNSGGFFSPPYAQRPFSPKPALSTQNPFSPNLALSTQNPFSPVIAPLTQYPANTSHATQYPANPSHSTPYPANPYPPYPYSANPYTADPYAANPPFASSYRSFPHFQPLPLMNTPNSVENEVENLKRELSIIKMENRARQQEERERPREKQRLRVGEYFRKLDEEAAKRKEGRGKNHERLKRQAEIQARAEVDQKLQPRRDTRGQKMRSETGKKQVEDDVRDAMDYIAAGRQMEENFRTQEERRGGDTERMLLEIVEFVEGRLRRPDIRRWQEELVRGSLEGPSRGRLEAAQREFVQNKIDSAMRSQIEDVVVDVLQRLRAKGEIQEVDFVSNKSTPASARQGQDDRQPPPSSKPANSALDEHESAGEGQRHPRKGKGKEPAPPNGNPGLQSSSHTTVNHSDRNSPSESNGPVSRPQRSPAPKRGPDREHSSGQSRPQQPRAPPDGNRASKSVPTLDNTEEQFSRSAGDGGHRFAANSQRGDSRNRPSGARSNERRRHSVQTLGMGRGRTRGRPETDTKRRRRWDTPVPTPDDTEYTSSDEPNCKDLFPTRSTRYAFIGPSGSRPNWRVTDETLLPVAPDPPLVGANPKWFPFEP
jgi:hypothetical protein